MPRKVKRGVAASSRKHESNSMKRGMEKKKACPTFPMFFFPKVFRVRKC